MEMVCRLLGHLPLLPPPPKVLPATSTQGSKKGSRRPTSATTTRRRGSLPDAARPRERPRSAVPGRAPSKDSGRGPQKKARPSSARPVARRLDAPLRWPGHTAAMGPGPKPVPQGPSQQEERKGYWRAGVELLRDSSANLISAMLRLAPVEVPQHVLEQVQELLKEADRHLKDEAYKETLRTYCRGGVDVCRVLADWAKAVCEERQAIRPAVLDLASQKVQMEQAEDKQRGRVKHWKRTCSSVEGVWFDAFVSTDGSQILVGDRYVTRAPMVAFTCQVEQ